MNDSHVNRRQIAASIRAALAEAGAAVGTRLRPERELARSLGMSHARLHRAIQQLVADGTLVQRQGSGTFVRRPPASASTNDAPSGENDAAVAAPALQLEPDQLLHQPDAAEPATGAGPGPDARRGSARSLDLRVWWESLAQASASQQSVLAGMAARAEAHDHRLALHSVHVQEVDPMLSKAEYVERFKACTFDACLMSAFAPKRLLYAAQDSGQPVVYFATASAHGTPEPAIMLDTDAGMELAMQRLHASGCQRIATVALAKSASEDTERRYRAAAAWCDQRYHSFQTASLDPFEAAEVFYRLLTHGRVEDRPDGLFVADDHLLSAASAALRRAGLTPGRDIGVVSHSNRGAPLAGDVSWSRVEYDTAGFGRLAIDRLVAAFDHPAERTGQITIKPRWVPGDTHTCLRAAHE